MNSQIVDCEAFLSIILHTDNQTIRQRLKEIIIEKSLLLAPPDKPFTLASGLLSTYYINGKKTTSDPEGLFCLCRLLFEAIKDEQIDAIGGPTLGADPIVGAYSIFSQLIGDPMPLFIVRKEAKGHGTGQGIEGADIAGKRVVMIEDVITTGGSVFKAINQVREIKGTIVKTIAIVDREQGGKEAFAKEDIPYQPLFQISELLPESHQNRGA